MVLANHVGKRCRTQLIGERTCHVAIKASGLKERCRIALGAGAHAFVILLDAGDWCASHSANQWIGIEHPGPSQSQVAVSEPHDAARKHGAPIDPAHYHRRTPAHRWSAPACSAKEEDRAPKAPRLDPFRGPDRSVDTEEGEPAEKPTPEPGGGSGARASPGNAGRWGRVPFTARDAAASLCPLKRMSPPRLRFGSTRWRKA